MPRPGPCVLKEGLLQQRTAGAQVDARSAPRAVVHLGALLGGRGAPAEAGLGLAERGTHGQAGGSGSGPRG